MEGYEVVTSDEKKVGTVVGTIGDNLIVEGGLFRKTRRALPLTFATADDGERVVRATVPKEIFDEGPCVEGDGQLDETAVARHYGLAGGEAAPETEGYGDLRPDDPGRSAEEQELRTGVTPATQERAAIRSDLNAGADAGGSPGRPIIPPDPHR